MFKYVVFLMILSSSFVQAQVLFQSADNMLSTDKYFELQTDPLVVPDRYRLARIDQNEIFRSINNDMPLVLNLFNDVELRANIKNSKELSSGSSFISGSLENGGHFTLFLHSSGVIRGEMHSSQGFYTIKSEGDDFNQILIKQEDLSELPRCGNEQYDSHVEAGGAHKQDWIPASAGMTGDSGATSNSTGNSKDWIPASSGMTDDATGTDQATDADTIEVLVVYTQRVEDHEGGPEQVKASIENEIAKMNQVLKNSDIAHRQIKLAAMEKVDYVQDEVSMGVDWDNLGQTSEDNHDDKDYSALDEVQDLREQYQADLIHLVVRDPTRACGTGSRYTLYQDKFIERYICQGSPDPSICLELERRKEWKKRRSDSVSSIKCTGRYAFTHELGHNLGLWHDRRDYNWEYATVEQDQPFRPYAFGYQNLEWSPTCQITIMSTGTDCVEAGVLGNVVVPYFSNPNLFFPIPNSNNSSLFKTDTPMGVPGDEYTIDLDGPVDAASAIDDVWEIVASLSDLDTETPIICNSGDIASNALTANLDSQTTMAAGGGTITMMLSFSVPDNCSGVSVTSSSSSSAVSTSVQKIGEGEFELSITAGPHNASCSSRSAEVTVELSGVSGVSPASTTVMQTSNNALCNDISSLPADSASLDVSGRNNSSSLTLVDSMFSRFTQLESLNLSNNGLSDFRSAIFDGLGLLKNLNLSNNQFTSLPESAFSNLLTIETLNLSKNKIQSMHASTFSAVEGESYQLKTLDLSYNEMGELPDSAFAQLIHLNTLKLNNNKIGELGEYTFFGPFQLEQLNLGYNEIETVHALSFWDNSKLTHLWLHGNKISSLSDSIFSNLTELRTISLSQNELTEIPDLSSNTKLEDILLYDNNISDLSSNPFSELSDLRIVHLRGNDLTTLPEDVFQNNANLEHLYLSSNDISSLPSNIFSGLSKLRALSLSGNKLTVMPNLSGLANLVNLWIYDNNISDLTTLPANVFQNNANLENLYLSFNEISSLPSDIFSGLSKLRALSLSGNKLTVMPNLSGLANLEHLYLSSNEISNLPSNIFAGLSNLMILDISRNQISTIEANAFSDLSEVTHIRLYDNNITSLSDSTFNGLSNVVSLNLSRNNITSLPNNAFSNMPNLRSLWFQFNEIQSISPNAFAGLSNLEYLNISFNPIQGPLPAEVCTFIHSVPEVHMDGIDMNTVCPQ